MREEAFLRAGLLLVAAATAEGGVELVLLDGVQKRHDLEPVAARLRAGLLHDPALVDGVLHARDLQPDSELFHELVAEGDGFVEVVAGIDVQQRERDAAGMEGFPREVRHHDGVFSTGEEQHGALELRGHLAHDEDGLGFEGAEVAVAVGRLDGCHRGKAGSFQRDPRAA